MPYYFSKSTNGLYDQACVCIPDDVVEITREELANLAGKSIAANHEGRPVIVKQAQPTANDLIKAQIIALEATATPRRLREAALGIDGGWLADLEARIDALRAQLTS